MQYEELDRYTYTEIKESIQNDYPRYMSQQTYKFSFSEATSKILYEFQTTLKSSELEKLMIYTQLALVALERNEWCFDIRTEIENLINSDILTKYKVSLPNDEYEEIVADIQKLKKFI